MTDSQTSAVPRTRASLLIEAVVLTGVCLLALFWLIPAQTSEGGFGLSPAFLPKLCVAVIGLLIAADGVLRLVRRVPQPRYAEGWGAFARVGAAISMKVEDYYTQGRRFWVRLHEKGGKRHEMPCHHNLDAYLSAYIEAAEIGLEKKGMLFRTAAGKTEVLTVKPMAQADVYRMIKRRAKNAGIKTEIGCHTFRATGITAYLTNGGKLEVAQQMAAHESARTTGLYDRRGDTISLDEVERIVI